MTDVIWIAVIGVVFVPLMTGGSFWIADRLSEFLAFVYMLVLALVVYPMIMISII